MTNTVGEGEVGVHFGRCSAAFFNIQVTTGHYKWFYMKSTLTRSHSQGLSSSRPVVGHPAIYSETCF